MKEWVIKKGKKYYCSTNFSGWTKNLLRADRFTKKQSHKVIIPSENESVMQIKITAVEV